MLPVFFLQKLVLTGKATIPQKLGTDGGLQTARDVGRDYKITERTFLGKQILLFCCCHIYGFGWFLTRLQNEKSIRMKSTFTSFKCLV